MTPAGVYGDFIPGFNIPGYATFPIFSEGPNPVAVWIPEKLLIVSPYSSDKASVLTDSEIASLPATNVQNQEPSKVWRTDGSLTSYLNFTFQTPIKLNSLAMGWPAGAFTDSGLMRVLLYPSYPDMIANTNAILDTAWNSVWPTSYRHYDDDWGPEVGLLRWDNEVAVSHARVWVRDLFNPLPYMDVSRIALGRSIQFVTNPRHEGGISYTGLDVQEPNGYGQVFTDPRPYQQRRFELVWSALADKGIKEDAMMLSRLRGQAGDIFIFIDPAAIDDFHITSMQGVFENQHKFTPNQIQILDKDGQFRKSWSFSMSVLQKL